ncbi:MAG TPA: hypothetical protein VJ731_04885 [Terriglobales bacterium]|nr:hypothetical protein [Terriglobales bacterium]
MTNERRKCYAASVDEGRKRVLPGVQVHDARLVAAMRVHGVKRILTFNDKDFARYTDIAALHPGTVSLA